MRISTDFRPVFPLLAALIATTAIAASGCSSQCKQVRSDYEEVLQSQKIFEAPASTEDMPVQLGLTLRTSLLNQIVDRAVVGQMEKALDFAEKIAVASDKSLSVRTEGDVADVEVFADSACPECLRLEGKLAGNVAVKVPYLGIQKVPLTGSFSIIAPLEFARAEDGGGEARLNLEKLADSNRSRVDAHITKLPPTWQRALQAPLSERILEALAESLGSVTIFEYDGPDLGVEGLEVLPVNISTDADHGVVFAGFTTNLAGFPTESPDLTPLTKLDSSENAALSIHPGLVGPAVRAMLGSDRLSRTYSKKGEADPEGAYHVTIDDAGFTPSSEGGAVGFESAFRVWNLADGDRCYWADARTSGTAAITDGTVTVTTQGIEIVEASVSDFTLAIATWLESDLLQSSHTVVEKSLTAQTIEFPGGELAARTGTLELEGGRLSYRGMFELK